MWIPFLTILDCRSRIMVPWYQRKIWMWQDRLIYVTFFFPKRIKLYTFLYGRKAQECIKKHLNANYFVRLYGLCTLMPPFSYHLKGTLFCLMRYKRPLNCNLRAYVSMARHIQWLYEDDAQTFFIKPSKKHFSRSSSSFPKYTTPCYCMYCCCIALFFFVCLVSVRLPPLQ